MKIIKDNIEKMLEETGYVHIEKYQDSCLNSAYNNWNFLDTYEEVLKSEKNISLETILYSKYYWFLSLADRFYELYGSDAGIEQQKFKLIEEMDQRLDGVDWKLVEKLDANLL